MIKSALNLCKLLSGEGEKGIKRLFAMRIEILCLSSRRFCNRDFVTEIL